MKTLGEISDFKFSPQNFAFRERGVLLRNTKTEFFS